MTILGWIVLGALACGFIHPIIGWSFLLLVSVIVYYALRKRGCKTCYYCKTCTLGFGKLPDLFFYKNGTENVDIMGLRMFPFVYILMSLLPAIMVVISILAQFSVLKIIILILLIIFSLFSGIVRRELFYRTRF